MELTEERILQELAAIGFARAEDYLEIREGQPLLKQGQHMAAIAAVETTSKGIKVKFYDKLKALELLGRHVGLFGGGGWNPEENNLLEAIMQASKEEVDAYDLPELQQTAADCHDLVESAGAEVI